MRASEALATAEGADAPSPSTSVHKTSCEGVGVGEGRQCDLPGTGSPQPPRFGKLEAPAPTFTSAEMGPTTQVSERLG